GRDGRALGALGELLAVGAEDEPVVDVLGRGRVERLVKAPVNRLVRPVVVPADHVCDPEVDVVDAGRELIGGGAVLAEERRASEPSDCDPGADGRAHGASVTAALA